MKIQLVMLKYQGTMLVDMLLYAKAVSTLHLWGSQAFLSLGYLGILPF